jgi:hypothetical protein
MLHASATIMATQQEETRGIRTRILQRLCSDVNIFLRWFITDGVDETTGIRLQAKALAD